ncbi:hypothetical protein J3D55_004169 [Chryseobacterium ginsenosidimutans]|uniref:hypothetical protein n=1 Tax=Chryseobacterium ginsenosidimutans TaxID=687846 RepID=UPI00216985AB|nr:hypothetical protein [Chryseobacterium ginsenosidimutans]MCS3871253.1 hypothetical protein [Chryseobacterium ginsenosidimutans]
MSKDLTEKKFKEHIQKHIDRVNFVKVNLTDDSSILGFIVKASDDFLMIEEANDFSLAGTKIIPYNRILGIRHSASDKVSKRIYSEESLIKLNQKIIDNTSLKDFESLFKSIKKQNFHCIIESRKKDQEIFSIGEILEITEKSVVIKNYNPIGKIDKKPRKISFKNIELINFNDNYSVVFRKYLYK